MTILPNGVAVLDVPDMLSDLVRERGLIWPTDDVIRETVGVLKPGDWVLDGGAALGDTTAAYLQAVGPTGKVIAFEPNPDYVECLRHNCPAAEIHLAALSDHCGTLGFQANSTGNLGNSRMVPLDNGTLNVLCKTIDYLELPRLDLLKLDVEGHEWFVLQGAEETIRRCEPVIQMEWRIVEMERQGVNPDAVKEWLVSHRYESQSIVGPLFGEGCEILAFHQG